MKTICLAVLFCATSLLFSNVAAAQSCGTSYCPTVSSWNSSPVCQYTSSCNTYTNYTPLYNSYASSYPSYYAAPTQTVSSVSTGMAYEGGSVVYGPNRAVENTSGSYSISAPILNQTQNMAPNSTSVPSCSNGRCRFN